MEKNMAVLMADLSGFTALTETHGAYSAADLIDRYLEIVTSSLVGDCELHERRGDEVMIVSESADFLLSTALMLLQNGHQENNFLQLHGGMHFGPVIRRGDSLFGTTINLTSRIVSAASAGSIWCSRPFLSALTSQDEVVFRSRGKQSFKNLSGENELFEIGSRSPHIFHIDPVCHMLIIDIEKAIPHPSDHTVYFCSQLCLEKYTLKQPVTPVT